MMTSLGQRLLQIVLKTMSVKLAAKKPMIILSAKMEGKGNAMMPPLRNKRNDSYAKP